MRKKQSKRLPLKKRWHSYQQGTANAYLFTGEQYDADLDMYFLRARYLNPTTGRFHTLDTYEGRNGEPATLHKYLYAHANPVNGIDPSGNFTLLELVIAKTISGTLRAVRYVGSTAGVIATTTRAIVSRIGASISRAFITEIGKTTVRRSIWNQISHLSAYERGKWLLANLRLRILTEPFTRGLSSFGATLLKGPTTAGWVGSGVVIGSFYYWGDDLIGWARRTLGIEEPEEATDE